ncbi:enoyl-CoA hydratase/isomerase [Streptomyces aurantiacus]|uniref:Putative Polyketide biosynthesis protein PksE n=1 Tax=Streptomyces aurantiacus JA 4570 TaxID=1286094 RepID=S3ZZI0_9ACTN|nr:enoyl-CoA hydratase/isomerase [Streptomyces aurantiacus]EPH43875.1 putative Polyketide biosynthesis protein PksE [Streptomyces aurantiacus JA 4570]
MDRLTYSTLRVREQGSVLTARIHRPEADNAINATLVHELDDVFARAAHAEHTTVVVLEGLPEVFCFGADFGVISDAARAGQDTAFDPEPMFELFRRMAYADVLTVAHVRGKANAGGVGLVAACDIVIADDSATFSLSELLFGLIPAVVLPYLIRRTGFQHAHYLAATTQTIDARQAHAWGLVDAVGPDSEALLRRHLQRLGRLSKKGVARYKTYLRELSPLGGHTKDVALATNREVFADPDNVRAIRRYAEDGVFPWESPTAPDAAPDAPHATSPHPPSETTVPPQDQPHAPSPLPEPGPPTAALRAPAPQAAAARVPAAPAVSPRALGNPLFREAHGVDYAYAAGAMYKGIASVDLVTALGNAGMLGFFGTGGLAPDAVDDAITRIKKGLDPGRAYGMNLLSNPEAPDLEARTVELFLRHGVRSVEASAYLRPTLPLVHYRLAGLGTDPDGRLRQDHHIIAKVSRTEVAEHFLRPAPAPLVRQLLTAGLVTPEQAELGARLPLAQDLCVEADSAGHTDGGNAYVLMPAMRALRDRVTNEERYADGAAPRIGAAGGIGTPEAALAALTLGADFLVTGSVNQCTVEAGTSEAVKEILQGLGVHDTEYAPAGDMFEMGARVQAVKKGTFFPARAQKLYDLYLRHDSLDDLDPRTRATLEGKYFKRSLDEVWRETRDHLARRGPERLAEVERSPKQKMAHVFRWYFVHSTRLALHGTPDQRVDYQIHCGPALGAFNSWVRGTDLEPWRNRRVDVVAERLLHATAALLTERLTAYAALTTGATPPRNATPPTSDTAPGGPAPLATTAE